MRRRWHACDMWAVLGLLGALVVATGAVPLSTAHDVALTRGGPLVGFLAALTVVAELSDRAEVFDKAAELCARAARGSASMLFVLIAVLGTLTTIGMGLDTTAVLLTPVVLALSTRLNVSPVPFALLAVWIANTASLLLPVSNLTNLLAAQRLALSTPTFAARMALLEVAAVTITVAYLYVLHRRDLAPSYELPAYRAPTDQAIPTTHALSTLRQGLISRLNERMRGARASGPSRRATVGGGSGVCDPLHRCVRMAAPRRASMVARPMAPRGPHRGPLTPCHRREPARGHPRARPCRRPLNPGRHRRRRDHEQPRQQPSGVPGGRTDRSTRTQHDVARCAARDERRALGSAVGIVGHLIVARPLPGAGCPDLRDAVRTRRAGQRG